MNGEFIVEFENNGSPFWLAPWEGDPGRTLVRDFARVFKIKKAAERALRMAQDDNPNRNLIGKVVPL